MVQILEHEDTEVQKKEKSMKYYSTNKQSAPVDFKEATIKGLAPDKGLYFPEYIPQVDKTFIQQIEKYSNAEIAYRIISPYIGDSIPANELQRIAREAIDFDIPLVKVKDNIFSLELFHGPTLAFKDVGARFMSRCLGFFAKEKNEKSYRTGSNIGRYGWRRCQWFLQCGRSRSGDIVSLGESKQCTGKAIDHIGK